MHFHLSKPKQSVKHKKDGRINPHRFWVFFVSAFLLVITIEIVAFTYFFVVSSKKLDAPVAPRLDTNIGQIKKIEQSIQKTEDAVSARTGRVSPSQNTAPIVQ